MRVVSTNSVVSLQPARARLDLAHQRLAVALAAEIRVHGERGELADLLVGKRVQRRAADDRVVVLGDDEALDLALEPLARAADEDALLLERLDDLQDAADVVDRRVAHVRERAPRRPSCPTPSRVKSSSSSAPSTWRLMRCARLTPLSHARTAPGR